jgi:hypothetical protein
VKENKWPTSLTILISLILILSLAVNLLKRQAGLDVYDYETRFNPLLIAE